MVFCRLMLAIVLCMALPTGEAAAEVLSPENTADAERVAILASGQRDGVAFTGVLIFEDREVRLLEGRRHGRQVQYYPDGRVRYEAHFEAGILHGATRSWFANGKLAREESWEQGRRTGEWRRYDEFGHLYSAIEYQAGNVVDNGLDRRTLAAWGQRFAEEMPTFFEQWATQSVNWLKAASPPESDPVALVAGEVFAAWVALMEAQRGGEGRPPLRVLQTRLAVGVRPSIDRNLLDYSLMPGPEKQGGRRELSDFYAPVPPEGGWLMGWSAHRNAVLRYAEAARVMAALAFPQDAEKAAEAEAASLQKLTPFVFWRLSARGHLLLADDSATSIVLNRTHDEAVLFVAAHREGFSLMLFWRKGEGGGWELEGAAVPGESLKVTPLSPGTPLTPERFR